MLQETKERMALLIAEQRIKEKAAHDLTYERDDPNNWLITFSVVMKELSDAEKDLNLQ
ncbi:hypothetical protein ACW2LR_000618 [Acinetobacter baumannii]|uniref:hypothetical protein n=1 Tax=Acinetobacter baumannii TaxID=470 RepID=UPI0021BD4373|nr:hypothetical protein [Acinetobacter baumannii]EKT8216701.1 hypothetical protein [Acinetobacter baumannii]EKT9546519.1 hypothetical protein [Acinetobacter baumannii]EKU0460381.1 hypothetical protein [Acinetobacter baumannii]EKU2073690.1 hypothetical protein [Acinetobacter baumannii]EKU2079373.1 hypothetical protein [Acinetobacter baumannii]